MGHGCLFGNDRLGGRSIQRIGIDEAITRSRLIHHHYGGSILEEKGLIDLLEGYRVAIRTTRDLMQRMGMVKACSVCAEEKAGGCCFEGVEEWYDDLLLLVNLLLGVELPHHREIDGECLFLGRQGCKLAARYSFCINFLCPALIASLKRSQREDFASVAGDEIAKGWELEKALRRWLCLKENHGHSECV